MSSSSFATVASRPTGGCSPPSSGQDSPPAAFAGAGRLTRAQLLAAPVRWPRPSRLRSRLELPTERLTDGLAALEVSTLGELLEHLPRDHREARTVSELRAGEQATVAVQVRSIAGRQVRRRGMRGLVEASVFDETGSMRATFFNQPWLVKSYPPGTRLVLHGKADGRRALSRFPPCGRLNNRTPEMRARLPHYPAADGVSSTQILTLVRDATRRSARRARAAAGRDPGGRAAARARRGARARCTSAAPGMLARGPQAARLRRAAADPACVSHAPWRVAPSRRDARGASAIRRRSASAGCGRDCRSQLTGDQRRAIATITDDLAAARGRCSGC